VPEHACERVRSGRLVPVVLRTGRTVAEPERDLALTGARDEDADAEARGPSSADRRLAGEAHLEPVPAALRHPAGVSSIIVHGTISAAEPSATTRASIARGSPA
jgi:hypothetical protein